jgi:hypothetical protein
MIGLAPFGHTHDAKTIQSVLFLQTYREKLGIVHSMIMTPKPFQVLINLILEASRERTGYQKLHHFINLVVQYAISWNFLVSLIDERILFQPSQALGPTASTTTTEDSCLMLRLGGITLDYLPLPPYESRCPIKEGVYNLDKAAVGSISYRDICPGTRAGLSSHSSAFEDLVVNWRFLADHDAEIEILKT